MTAAAAAVKAAAAATVSRPPHVRLDLVNYLHIIESKSSKGGATAANPTYGVRNRLFYTGGSGCVGRSPVTRL